MAHAPEAACQFRRCLGRSQKDLLASLSHISILPRRFHHLFHRPYPFTHLPASTETARTKYHTLLRDTSLLRVQQPDHFEHTLVDHRGVLLLVRRLRHPKSPILETPSLPNHVATHLRQIPARDRIGKTLAMAIKARTSWRSVRIVNLAATALRPWKYR